MTFFQKEGGTRKKDNCLKGIKIDCRNPFGFLMEISLFREQYKNDEMLN